MGYDPAARPASSSPDPPFEKTPDACQATNGSLQIALFQANDGARRTSEGREWPAGWRRVAAAYCVGAALFSAVITAAGAVEASAFRASALFGMWWINAWPIVPTLILLLLLDRRASLRLVASYLAGGSAALAALTLLVQAARQAIDSAPLTNIFWLNAGLVATAWLPLLLVVISGWHRIRGVMPLALSTTLLFGIGLLLFRRAIVLAFNASAVGDVLLELSVPTSAQAAYYSLYLIIALPVGWLAWRCLRALAGAFEHKRFSDMQLVVDCWWLIVVAETIATSLVAPFGLAGIGIGVAAFAAYRGGTFTTLRLLRQPSAGTPARLLLLRVFGHQSRSETLFDRIAQRWRFRGPVLLIAGADLAMRTADPGDMLAFVGGRLREVYVSSASQLPARLARLDMNRDPDGRYRVNEVYCANETWKNTLLALLERTDVVVMDLRGFGSQHAGCVYELQQLVTRLPAAAIVLVCDRTTDFPVLAALLGRAWAAAGDAGTRAGTVSLVRVDRNSPAELDTLTERLLGRGSPKQVLTLRELPALA
jgi:hypothetical protein